MAKHVNEMFYTDPEHRPFHFEAGSSRASSFMVSWARPVSCGHWPRSWPSAGVTARGVLLPGFGAIIARLKEARAEEWLAAARAAWEETREGATRTTLIGFSMGGAVALRLAAEAGLAPGSARPAGATLEIRRPPRGRPSRGKVPDP